VTRIVPALSIVVPAGPGDEAWRALLPALVRDCTAARLGAQVLLVLPTDAPSPHAVPATVDVVHAPVGRASQLNAGAQAAVGAWLWFVHADSVLDARAIEAVARCVGRDRDELAYLDLRFDRDGPALVALNTLGAWLRSRVLRLPFGDQALLVPRRVFDRLGGFAPVAGEDHAFVWAARRAGVPLRPLGATVRTSARRYAAHGWLATTARHLVLTAQQAWRYSRMRGSA
jgi:hypothetical protein